MAGRKPGTPKTGGRVKGTPNKLSASLKEMILGALDDVGGRAYLAQQAILNPGPYMSLLGKVLPQQVDAQVEHRYVARIPSISNDMDEWDHQHASKLNSPQTLQ